MSTYASDAFTARGSYPAALIGSTPDGTHSGNWVETIWGTPTNEPQIYLDGSTPKVYCGVHSNGFYSLPAFAATGSPSAVNGVTQLQVSAQIQVKSKVGLTGVSMTNEGPGTQVSTWCYLDAANGLVKIGSSYGLSAVQASVTVNVGDTPTIALLGSFNSGTGVNTFTAYYNGTAVCSTTITGSDLVTPQYGLYFSNAGTGATTSTGVHVLSYQAGDPAATPTGLTLTTLNVVTGGMQNMTGVAGVGSRTPVLIGFTPANGVAGSGGVPVALSDGGAGGTFAASTVTIAQGQATGLAYYTPAAGAAGTTVTLTATSSGLTTATLALPVSSTVVVLAGNSYGAAYNVTMAQCWAGVLAAILPGVAIYNASVSGIRTGTLTSNAPSQWGPSTGIKGSGTNVVILQELINDMQPVGNGGGGVSPATAYANVQAFYSQAHGWGWTVHAFNLHGIVDQVSLANINAVNALMAGGQGTAWDKLLPINSDARFAPGNYVGSPYASGDTLHPTAQGYAVYATYPAIAIQPSATASPLPVAAGGGIRRVGFNGGMN